MPDFGRGPAACTMEAREFGKLGGRPTKGKAVRSAIMLAVVAGSQRTLAFGGASLSLSAPPHLNLSRIAVRGRVHDS